MDGEQTIRLEVPVLTRVEGEGALDLNIKDKKIESLALRIYEPPRYFEKFLEGRSVDELPEMVARICGICPVAYQMSAVLAVESLFEGEVTPWVAQMRRLFYCGEWIQSHSLHIHLLAAPDFLGHPHAISMASEYPDEVRRGLRLQGLGNQIIALLGGRSVHPVGARVGGFHRAPSKSEVAQLLVEAKSAVVDAEALLRWLVTIELPQEEQNFVSVALSEPDAYPVMGRQIVSDNGLDLPIEQFEQRFEELQVPHSTAFHALLDGEPYLVGPLARLNINNNKLHSKVKVLCGELGVRFPSRNMFDSIVARGVELLQMIRESVVLLEQYQRPSQPWSEFSPKAGVAFGATCAPRGMLWHRYQLDAEGKIQSAQIVPPTSQNQARIEADLYYSLNQFGLDRSQEAIKLHGEQVIRNYDPCISCATHFLDLRMKQV
ncbi:MAG: Ni/Fe hydrogenase subunit alpha [Gammaproteobacteria bacterium]|jgi:coenzyme F420-reducing hydrogenase alpha subunit|nr:Ni/Fe hydrogenase subunit alpha [Gammaproteobacteria bacterium]MBT3488831.1 Ni/Fe hydrogenase subunit alpha [Gammaproteobacteria bacterium]MBT3718798.1 Ni/Fe hydrogenase subunit alpha [Gammaproteobacteria bacterium]MBT3845888.1 Ni/Fe hydrogenase subunit alpha [Gammaproteobacteria bacterium]MBT3894261.1 Ni/Fe hydrogenase subunit alpha [Gammaproteobacteria bacterium]